MWPHFVIVPVVLAIACGLWVVIQLYFTKRHPDIRGPEDSASGCCSGGLCGGGHGHCEEHAERHPEEAARAGLPEARVEGSRRR